MQWSRSFRYSVPGAILFLSCALSVASHAQGALPKKRIAVLNFDNPRIGPDAASGLFGADAGDVGKGVSAELIEKLLEGGKFTIVDRSALEELLKQQSNTDREALDAYGMAARVGRMLALDAMIIGVVSRYGLEETDKGTHGSGVHTRKAKASVTITSSVFNVTTGEVMAAFTATGESAHSGDVTLVPARGRSSAPVQILSNDFVQNLFPEATSDAVAQLASQIRAFAEKIPTLQIAVEGRVAEIVGNTLTLTVGKQSGVQVGDRVEILHESANAPTRSDVTTVQPLPGHVGSATIREVADTYATATFSGSGHVQVGDCIRRIDNPAAPPR